MEIPTDPILQMQFLQALTLSMREDTVMEIVDNAPEVARRIWYFSSFLVLTLNSGPSYQGL